MIRCALRARRFMIVLFALILTACGGATTLFNTVPTIYDLTQRPKQFAGQEVTVQGVYLWKPGNPGTSVLLPGVSTADEVRDAQPIYASVTCNGDDECQPSKTAVGEPSTGAVWLENFPPDVTADLHRPEDSVWGMVQVTGLFEANGGYGPDGAYRYRMNVKTAKALDPVERVVSAVEDKPLGDGKVSIFELNANPDKYNGQKVTSQGYYFWSPATQGSFVEKVEREKTDTAAGLAPRQAGIVMGLDGFPPELSEKLNVGPNGSFVWGLVEVTGTFEKGSFADGRYDKQIKVDPASVKVLEQPTK